MHWNHWLESLSLVNRTDLFQSGSLFNGNRRFFGDIIEESSRELQAIVDLKQGLAVCTSPADGAEISALAVCDNGQWREILYRANEFAKVEGWPGRAPWLWPIAGRCYAVDRSDDECTWQWNGEVRPMTRHGFARHQTWRAGPPTITVDGVTSTAEFHSDFSHRASYPFDYHLTTSQQLSNSGLEITYRVVASPENTGPMPFVLGLHFTFNFSSWWGNDWLQGRVAGLGPCAWHTDNRAQASEQFELPFDSVHLSDSTFDSAIIPARANAPVRIVSPDGARALEMSFTETSGIGDGDLAWVSFVDPLHRFFCLEPWVGWPNAINSGRGRVELQPGKSWGFRLQIAASTFRSTERALPTTLDKKAKLA